MSVKPINCFLFTINIQKVIAALHTHTSLACGHSLCVGGEVAQIDVFAHLHLALEPPISDTMQWCTIH